MELTGRDVQLQIIKDFDIPMSLNDGKTLLQDVTLNIRVGDLPELICIYTISGVEVKGEDFKFTADTWVKVGFFRDLCNKHDICYTIDDLSIYVADVAPSVVIQLKDFARRSNSI